MIGKCIKIAALHLMIAVGVMGFVFRGVAGSAIYNVGNAHIYNVKSPDGRTVFELTSREGGLLYRVRYDGQETVSWSDLGFVVDGRGVGVHTVISGVKYTKYNHSFVWPLGENERIENNYNGAVFNLMDGDVSFSLVVRAYAGSVAFRYEMIGQHRHLTLERTCFNFTQPLTIYQYNQESVFAPVDLNSMQKTCDFPATLTNNRDLFISIGEADNTGYTKAELLRGETNNSLSVVINHDTSVSLNGSFISPWRTISMARTAIGLHDYSDLYLRLTGTDKNRVPAWVLPGKLIRSQLTTEDGMRAVDFASKEKFQYILFDAGWYGKEFNSSSDPRRYIEQLDIPKVVQYGKSKHVGILLYVNYVGLRNYIDDIIPLYKKWGVAGLKFGFVDGLSQKGIEWLVTAVKKVTDSGMIVNVHDNYKPTGLSRLMPGWLTQEGVRGDENSPDAFHTTVLPFTRFLAGPADFTFCYPNSKNTFSKNLKVSRAQQLALTVIYFSPLQAIFWYGRPEDYTDQNEIEFFSRVPTVWDETRYLAGDIGKFISVARRKGNSWYIGNAAGLAGWKGLIKLDFLEAGKSYLGEIWQDSSEGKIFKTTRIFKKGDKIYLNLKGAGGEALILTLRP